MSTNITKEIVCPKCSHGHEINMYTGINNSENPEFKERILKEDIFDWKCPNCGYFSQMVYPVVYFDLQKNYVIALTPSAGKADTIKPTDLMKNSIKRRVKSLAELKEKILILDEGFDDIAIEISKNALCSILKKTYDTNKIKAYFSKVAVDKSIMFAVFLGGKKEAFYQGVKPQVYNQSVQVLNSVEYKEPDNVFLRVGPTLVTELLEEYKKQ